MPDDLPKSYQPGAIEARWAEYWIKERLFSVPTPPPGESRPVFTLLLPPPNVTGRLHMGHMLNQTQMDIIVRWHRMRGFITLWLPGTDHAGIATQMMVERQLVKEGKKRRDMGREKFVERVWEWKREYGGAILDQMKRLGASVDWDREYFTMNENLSRAVGEVFLRLYEEGLIYRGKYIVNWCPRCETAISDLEVKHEDVPGKLYEVRYPVIGSDEFITVATTRPETMLGDTAVAVNAVDERYKHLHGKKVLLPLTGRQIPIVPIDLMLDGKPWPDPTFGSGAVKVTPAHDPSDYEVSLHAGLPALQVIDAKGRICAPAPAKYVGMAVDQARKAVVADLEAAGLLGAIKDYRVPRGRSQRSGAVIEPMLMEQWWVKAAPLAEKAIAAVEQGKTKFVPEHEAKTFMHWMTNIKDWCISRQLWWGHRIPAWHCACGGITVAREAPAACRACGGTALRQDDDILDTWFSSGLWPFSTLGWPEKTRELSTFYPNNVLVTAPDILFFWVAPMMMMGLHFLGKVPFRTVYLTSIITDENGAKMSKTKGNGIDPLDVFAGAGVEQLIERVDTEKPPVDLDALKKNVRKNFPRGVPAMGADALRFAFAALNTTGRIRLSVDRVEKYRNFINKLWNASRFALMSLDGYDPERFEAQLTTPAGRTALGMAERWILSRLQA